MEGRPKHLDDEIDVKIFDKFYLYSFTLCCILSNRFSTYRGWEGGGLMSHNAACQWKTGVKKGIAGECVT